MTETCSRTVSGRVLLMLNCRGAICQTTRPLWWVQNKYLEDDVLLEDVLDGRDDVLGLALRQSDRLGTAAQDRAIAFQLRNRGELASIDRLRGRCTRWRSRVLGRFGRCRCGKVGRSGWAGSLCRGLLPTNLRHARDVKSDVLLARVGDIGSQAGLEVGQGEGVLYICGQALAAAVQWKVPRTHHPARKCRPAPSR